MIFLDHIPHDVVAWLTLRNYGFSDAAEFFVFISGYLAWINLWPNRARWPFSRGHQAAVEAGRGDVRRPHHAVSVFTAQIARTARKFDNPMYENEFNVFNFLQHPDVLIGQALTLRYKPVNLDVSPLYNVDAASPLMLWCLVRRPNWTLLLRDPLRCRALVRLEFRFVPPGDLVLQSVCLAIVVRIRGVVRRRGRR